MQLEPSFGYKEFEQKATYAESHCSFLGLPEHGRGKKLAVASASARISSASYLASLVFTVISQQFGQTQAKWVSPLHN